MPWGSREDRPRKNISDVRVTGRCTFVGRTRKQVQYSGTSHRLFPRVPRGLLVFEHAPKRTRLKTLGNRNRAQSLSRHQGRATPKKSSWKAHPSAGNDGISGEGTPAGTGPTPSSYTARPGVNKPTSVLSYNNSLKPAKRQHNASYMDWMRSARRALRGVADTTFLPRTSPPLAPPSPSPPPSSFPSPRRRISTRCPYASPADVAWTNQTSLPFNFKTCMEQEGQNLGTQQAYKNMTDQQSHVKV